MGKTLAKILLATALIGMTGCPPAVIPKPELPPIILPKVDVTQGEKKTVNLSYLANDSGITWESAEDNSDLITTSLSGDNLSISVSDEVREDVSYSITLKAKRENKEETLALEGIVKNIVEISGNLKNNETETNQAGLVKLFDSVGSKIGEYNAFGGNFNFVSSLREGKAKLQARLNNGYIRTIKLSLAGKDISGIEIYAVPKVDFDINDDGTVDEKDSLNFIDFMKQTNTTPSVEEDNGKFVDVSLINKWNLDDLIAIEICKTNSEKEIQLDIKETELIYSLPQLPLFIARKKDLGSIVNFYEESSMSHEGIPGYITIIPDDIEGTIGGIGLTKTTFDYTNPRRAISSVIHLLTAKNLTVNYHEFGHSFIAQVGEAENPISPSTSIMFTSGNILSSPGLADEKAGKLLYEETYLAGENLDNILRTKFIDDTN
jgi:hypothetical protein